MAHQNFLSEQTEIVAISDARIIPITPKFLK